jgi:hypothetical protein
MLDIIGCQRVAIRLNPVSELLAGVAGYFQMVLWRSGEKIHMRAGEYNRECELFPQAYWNTLIF